MTAEQLAAVEAQRTPRRAIVKAFLSDTFDGAIYELEDGRFIASCPNNGDVEVPNIDRALALFSRDPVHGDDGIALANVGEVASWRRATILDTHYPIS